MLKKIPLIVILCTILLGSIGWAVNPLELIAPGGGEMDLNQNLAKYYGTGNQQVEAHWGEYQLYANYLEYYRTLKIIKVKGRVQLEQNINEKRSLKCEEMKVDLNKNLINAYQGVEAQLDKDTCITCGALEWDRNNDWIKLTDKPKMGYQDWKISGNVVEGKPKEGLMTITGDVQGLNKDTEFKAGKLIADRTSGLFYLRDNPQIIRGKSQVTATEIIYDLKTKKISAKGVMKSKTIE